MLSLKHFWISRKKNTHCFHPKHFFSFLHSLTHMLFLEVEIMCYQIQLLYLLAFGKTDHLRWNIIFMNEWKHNLDALLHIQTCSLLWLCSRAILGCTRKKEQPWFHSLVCPCLPPALPPQWKGGGTKRLLSLSSAARLQWLRVGCCSLLAPHEAGAVALLVVMVASCPAWGKGCQLAAVGCKGEAASGLNGQSALVFWGGAIKYASIFFASTLKWGCMHSLWGSS